MAFSRPIRSLKLGGITPEARAQRKQVFQALIETLRPFVTPIAEKKAESAMYEGRRVVEREIASLPLPQRMYARFMQLPSMLPGREKKMNAEQVVREVEHASTALACALIQTCLGAAVETGGSKKTISISKLDDMMPPRLGDEAGKWFEIGFEDCVIDATDARIIIVSMHFSPKGSPLLVPVIEVLKLYGVDVTP